MLNIQKKMSNSFYALLSMPSTAMGFALSVQISVLSWILSTKYGLDIHEIGIVWAAGPVAGIIAQPIVGLISDKMWFLGGRRRPWIVLGGILSAFMMLALPNLEIVQQIFVGGDDPMAGLLAIAVIVALTFDISINVSLNPTRSIVADCTTMENRAKGYTWMQTVSGSFGVLAYLIGGIFGNMALLYVGIFITLFGTLIPPFFIEEPRHLEAAEEGETGVKSKTTFKDIAISLIPLSGLLIYGIYVICIKLTGVTLPNMVEFGIVHLNIVEIICILLVVVSAFIVVFNLTKSDENGHEFQKILYAHSFSWIGVQTMFIYALFYINNNLSDLTIFGFDGLDSGQVNSYAFFILSLVSTILPVFVLNRASKRYGMVAVHTVCIFLMALGYGLIYIIPNTVLTYFLLIGVCGIGWSSIISLVFAIMSERVDQSKMGLYMGIFNLSVVLPQLVASFKMGEIINASPDDNKAIIFSICAICLALSGIFWLAVKNHK
ncbi:MAG: MFS transporter [bacterium]